MGSVKQKDFPVLPIDDEMETALYYRLRNVETKRALKDAAIRERFTNNAYQD